MKKYFCCLFILSIAYGMDQTPPASPQWHSAPNSTTSGRIQYSRKELLDMYSLGSLYSMSALIALRKIQLADQEAQSSEQSAPVVGKNPVVASDNASKKHQKNHQRYYAKK